MREALVWARDVSFYADAFSKIANDRLDKAAFYASLSEAEFDAYSREHHPWLYVSGNDGVLKERVIGGVYAADGDGVLDPRKVKMVSGTVITARPGSGFDVDFSNSKAKP